MAITGTFVYVNTTGEIQWVGDAVPNTTAVAQNKNSLPTYTTAFWRNIACAECGCIGGHSPNCQALPAVVRRLQDIADRATDGTGPSASPGGRSWDCMEEPCIPRPITRSWDIIPPGRRSLDLAENGRPCPDCAKEPRPTLRYMAFSGVAGGRWVCGVHGVWNGDLPKTHYYCGHEAEKGSQVYVVGEGLRLVCEDCAVTYAPDED